MNSILVFIKTTTKSVNQEVELSPVIGLHLNDLKNKNIPLILLNARLTKKTFNNWIKIKTAKGFFKSTAEKWGL